MLSCQYEIHISKNDTYSMSRPHFHEEIEISFCTSGEGVLFLESEVIPLFRGRLFLVDSSVLHRCVANEAYRCVCFHISQEMLRQLSSFQSNFIAKSRQSGLVATLEGEEIDEMERLMENLMRDFGGGFGDDIRRIISVLSFLVTCFSYFDGMEAGQIYANASLAKVAPVLSYIHEHLAENLSTQSIASAFFMSRYHLCHIFKEGTGFSMIDYVINCRILRARMLLREGRRVQEAGEMVGFRSNEHFIRTFKRLTGMSPKQYAIQYRESGGRMGGEVITVEGKTVMAPIQGEREESGLSRKAAEKAAVSQMEEPCSQDGGADVENVPGENTQAGGNGPEDKLDVGVVGGDVKHVGVPEGMGEDVDGCGNGAAEEV